MGVKTASKRDNNDVPPHIPSGFSKNKKSIAGYLSGLTAVYATIYYGFLHSESVMGFPKPKEEYCQEQIAASIANGTEVVCSRSDMLAFQIASGFAITFCGLLGFYTWHITGRAHTALPATPEGRLYGYLEESEKLAAVNFAFQFWDFFISLLIPEHRGALMLMHHVAASTVCFLSLEYQVLHYYGVFFLGVTEFSSIFLVVVDLANYFPPSATHHPIYDMAVAVSGPLFAVTFAIYRVFLWWKVSFQLWQDCHHVVSKGISDMLRPGKNYVLYIFLFLNVPLGLLQLYWFSIILGEARKLLGGEGVEELAASTVL